MSTRYETVPVKVIRPNPANPRTKVTVNQQLVDSVAQLGVLQPLLVVPADDAPGMYDLIAGHRRLAALKKLKRTEAPVIIDPDLGPQFRLGAMVVENTAREDLTPLEEAQAFEQLALDMSVAQISKVTGHDSKTIADRRRMLKLPEAAKKKVHKGQLTVDDAVQIAEYADDPEAVARLEKSVTDYGGLKSGLAAEERRVKGREQAAADAAQWAGAGVSETPYPEDAKGIVVWKLLEDKGWDLVTTHGFDGIPEPHTVDCLTYMVSPETTYSSPRVEVACTTPTAHDAERAALKAKQEAERETLLREAREQTIAMQAASVIRTREVAAVGEGVKLDPKLRDLLRALLPAMVSDLRDAAPWQELTGVPEGAGWGAIDTPWSGSYEASKTAFVTHFDDIATWSNQRLVSAFTAWAACLAEESLDIDVLTGHYVGLLDALGHEWTPVEEPIYESADDTEGGAA